MMDETKLKPCPFCGQEMRLVYSSVLERFVIAHINPYNCYFRSFEINGIAVGSLTDAKEAWNRRASDA